MTFFTADNIREVTGGAWVVAPSYNFTFAGIGTDTRVELAGRAFLALRGPNHDAHEYLDAAAHAGAKLLIVDRTLDPSRRPDGVAMLKVDDTRAALSAMARAYRRTLTDTTVIAVTGSTGKTTTKELIHAALSAELSGSRAPRSFNNDIGVPLTILAASASHDYLVLELGMNAPGEIAALSEIARPDIAVITTIGPAHLDRFGTIEAIAAEKLSLLDHLHPYGVAVLNADYAYCAPPAAHPGCVTWFGESDRAHVRLTEHGRDDTQDVWWFDVNDHVRFRLPLPGRHNAVNALAAVTVARHLGLSDTSICTGMVNVRLPAMRMARQNVRGVVFYNDAYNANPQSMRASLQAFLEQTADAPRRIIVLGDMLELGASSSQWHRALGEELIELNDQWQLDNAFFIGECMAEAEDVVARQWCSERVQAFQTLNEDVVARIWSELRPGDAVLLKGSRGMALERLIHDAPAERAGHPTSAVA